MTSSCAAASVSACIEVGVQLTWTPWKRHTCSATLVVVTGRANWTRLRSAATRSSTASRARSSLTSSPFSSTIWIRSPTGSNLTPKAALDEDTTSASPCRPARRRAAVPLLRDGLGRRHLVQAVVQGEHVHADGAEQAGQHQRRGASGAISDHFQVGLADAAHIDAPEQLVGVGL